MIFAGRTYEYRDRFQAKEIPGGFPGSGGGEEKGKYCRVLKSVDVSEEAEVEKVWVVVIGLLSRLTIFSSARIATKAISFHLTDDRSWTSWVMP